MNRSLISDKPFRIVFVACFCAWSFIHLTVLNSYGLTVRESLADSLVSNVSLAGCCMLVISNMRYYLPGKEKYWYVLVLGLAISCIWLISTRALLWLLLRSDIDYISFLKRSSPVRYGIAFLVISCIEAMGLLWYTQQEQSENENRRNEITEMAKEAELFKLRQQLQPHFLFNSLNSISALTGSQPEKARHMIQQLSDFLRGTLRKEDDHWNTLNEELEYLQLYLEIEKVRFGQRLQTTINIAERTTAMKLPALLLQPIVENAIKFGLYDTIGEVNIGISSTIENSQLQIRVENPYDAETSGHLSGTGFGLSSISRRLYLLFARQDLLKTETKGSIFITTIIIPQITK
ncbi:hypothetical protein BH11BAC4_BH11BAC4_18050 [soil metagenome]